MSKNILVEPSQYLVLILWWSSVFINSIYSARILLNHLVIWEDLTIHSFFHYFLSWDLSHASAGTTSLFLLFYFNFYSCFYFQILDFSRGFISSLLFSHCTYHWSLFLQISSYLLGDQICNSSLTLIKEIVRASCPSAPLKVATKSCQTFT